MATANFTQLEKLISVSVTGQEDDALLLQSFMGTESISRPYLYRLDVLTTDPSLDFSQVLGQQVSIKLQTTDPANPRYFNGFVSSYLQTDGVAGFGHYRMDVVPWIWFLGLHVDCRIFHNKTIPEIVEEVLSKSPAAQKGSLDKSNLQVTYPKLEYVVQYRESSLSFISRLMEHAGIFYFFQHTDSEHTMYLYDNSSLCGSLPIGESNISYLLRNSGEMHEEVVSSLHARQEVKTGAHTHTNYNFKTPSTSLKTSEPTVISAGQNGPLEIFEYPSNHANVDDGKALSRVRMQEHESRHHLLTGNGHTRNFAPGYKFTLENHPQDSGALARNIEYLITEVQHSITVGAQYVSGVGGESYSNQFTCIPAAVPYRPSRITPKPLVYGLQTGVVIGKASDTENSNDEDAEGSDGEEIWVDKYGRIIVRFPWDREGKCSCRVRVAQPWAGKGWGAITIPRVGQEVLVSFIDGDPDRPIVVGGVYNAEQTAPYKLPDYQTRSTMKSHSTTQGGDDNYNEFRFEDKKGSEQVFIRGEKDADVYVKNDSREWIGNNRSLLVKKDQMEKVEGDVHLEVVGKQTEKIGGDLNTDITGNYNHKAGQTISLQAGQNLYEKSGQNYAHDAGQAIHLKAGMTVVIEAGTQLSLKVGGNFIDINPSGVSISGTMVMINSGGSAGSGSGSSPTSPGSPTKPDEADDGSKGTKMNG